MNTRLISLTATIALVAFLFIIPASQAYAISVVYIDSTQFIGSPDNVVSYTLSITPSDDRRSGSAEFTIINSANVAPELWAGEFDFKFHEGNERGTITSLTAPAGLLGAWSPADSLSVPMILSLGNKYRNNYLSASAIGFFADSLQDQTPNAANLVPITGMPSTYVFGFDFTLPAPLRADAIPFQVIYYDLNTMGSVSYAGQLSQTLDTTHAPEPSTFVLLGLGLLVAGAFSRRIKK